MTPSDGVLRVDKPAGPSSHDVVNLVRRALGTRRVGHTGTLDPFATGLLLVCIGRATRLSEYLTGLPKRYRATARLGRATDTCDSTGEVVSENENWRDLDEERVQAAVEALRGESMQRPPDYSAKKIGGRRAYELARSGAAVEVDPVPITVYAIDRIQVRLPEVEFEVECSSGTYVRALARDLGEALGVGAHLRALRRTRVGRHVVDGAVPVDRLEDPAARERAWLSPIEAIEHLPRVGVDERGAQRVGHGRAVPVPETVAGGLVALESNGGLIAIAQVEDGAARPRKVFT